MAVQQLGPLRLSDDERAELKAPTTRRKTAQALALRARIVLACAERGPEHGSGGQTGPRQGNCGQMAPAFCRASRGRAAR
jgi:hypothetical protein